MLRPTIRSVRRNAGFSLLVISILALGIGANSAIFAVISGIVLKPLAFPDPDRLVHVRTVWDGKRLGSNISGPDFHDLHDQSSAFSAMGYYWNWESRIQVNGRAKFAGVSTVT